MEYVIELLETEKKQLNQSFKSHMLMQKDIKKGFMNYQKSQKSKKQ